MTSIDHSTIITDQIESERQLRLAYQRMERGINQLGVDPMEIMARLQSAGPLVRGQGLTFLGWTMPPVFRVPADAVSAMAISYEAATTAMGGEHFRAGFDPNIGGDTFLHMDGPPHRRWRLLLGEVFSLPACERWGRDVVEPTVRGLVDGIVANGRADLRLDLAERIPPTAYTAILGVPAHHARQMQIWAVNIIASTCDAEAKTLIEPLGPYLTTVLAERRRLSEAELDERRDLITCLIRAHHPDFDDLTDDEIMSALYILVAAGNETTGRALTLLLFELLRRPDVLDVVRNDRSLIPAALDEAMRLWPPGGCFEVRAAVSDQVIDGQAIDAGAVVISNLYTANRDPARWDRPDEFDIARKRKPNVAFGYGPHLCLGMHLARIEVTAGMNEILDRLPHLRLDPDAAPSRIAGMWFPGVDHLRVRWG